MRSFEFIIEATLDPDAQFYKGKNPFVDPIPMRSDPASLEIPDYSGTQDPEASAERMLLTKNITQLMKQLPPNMREIISMRFYSDMTLDQIAKKYGISSQEVRRIEQNALSKLRGAGKDKLRSFISSEPQPKDEIQGHGTPWRLGFDDAQAKKKFNSKQLDLPAHREMYRQGYVSGYVKEEQLDELTFKGSPCTKDCSGHRAGYEWSRRKGGVDAASWSPSFNKGAWLFKNGH